VPVFRGTNPLVAAAVLCGMVLLAARAALPQTMVSPLPYQGILAIRAPGQLDVATIDAIADVGVKEVVKFSAGGDVAGFIAKKCGRPSLTVAVHPRYREKLIAANQTGAAANADPLVLAEDRALTMPACAGGFAIQLSEFEVPNGVQALMQKLSIPFDLERYQRLTGAQNFQSAVSEEYRRLAENPYPDGQVCRASDLVSFFACVNAIEIAYVNRDRIKTADQITGKVRVPVAPLDGAKARVPIAAETAEQLATVAALQSETDKATYKSATGITNLTPVAPPAASDAVQAIAGVSEVRIAAASVPSGNSDPSAKRMLPTMTPASARFLPRATAAAAPPAPLSATIEDEVKFVTAVDDVTKFDPACSDAHKLNKDRWPFDVAEFERVLVLNSSLMARPALETNLLVVDTGFDFTYDGRDSLPAPERYIFPKQSFAQNTDAADNDGDGIPDNFNFSGVNLAMNKRSSATHPLDMTRRRSHGLAVTTLALGGRDLQYLRNLGVLKTKVGIASLVPTDRAEVVLNAGHFQRIMRYAAAAANNYSIVNLSLSTRDELEGFKALMSTRRVFVAAAGNDDIKGKALHDKATAIYPAAFGGSPVGAALETSVVITVGAHKGNGKLADFSYFSGSKVDVLAPGCMLPSYELRKIGDDWADPPRVVPSFVSGTSFAAPLVSFFASVLMSYPGPVLPGTVKQRVLVGTDFDFELKPFAFSSGRLNPAKMLSIQLDVLETLSDGQRKTRFGTVTNKGLIPSVSCQGETVPFADVKKLAFDPASNQVLLISNHEPDVPRELKRMTCEANALQGITYVFKDAETDEELTLDAATQVVDYIARR
jgi:hypothetical protein